MFQTSLDLDTVQGIRLGSICEPFVLHHPGLLQHKAWSAHCKGIHCNLPEPHLDVLITELGQGVILVGQLDKCRHLGVLASDVLGVCVVHSLGPMLPVLERPQQIFHFPKEGQMSRLLCLEINPHCVAAIAAAEKRIITGRSPDFAIVVRHAVTLRPINYGCKNMLTAELKIEAQLHVRMWDTMVPLLAEHMVILTFVVA